ncbi:MAG: hypothetical protein Tsb0034_26670 [Ekhidna sp.]
MQGGRDSIFILRYLALLAVLRLPAQEITVNGGFVEDSLIIGQNIHFWMTASYPPEMEMVFPDSKATFSPFEYAGKAYYDTKMHGGAAFDSTVYTLQSFEIDPVQYLKLNAVILQATDSVIIPTPVDSIFLTELAPVVTDSTELKKNLSYQAVNRQFNYPLLYYILGGLALLILLCLLIFGKRILKYLKLRKLARDHRIFSERFGDYVRRLKETPDPLVAEEALSTWKRYQQKLDKEAFSTFTTKEILALGFTSELEKPLKSIDRMVYGNRVEESIYQDFEQIEDFTSERYKKKVGEIKHGK